jgi:hypothetical protein
MSNETDHKTWTFEPSHEPENFQGLNSVNELKSHVAEKYGVDFKDLRGRVIEDGVDRVIVIVDMSSYAQGDLE